MQVSCPMVYPIIDAKKNYLNYDLSAYLDYRTTALPMKFFLELATKLDVDDDAFCARTSAVAPVGAFYIPLFSINMPYSFFVLIIIDLLYALVVKKAVVPGSPLGEAFTEPVDDSEQNDANPDSEATFPKGLDIYLVINSVFRKKNPRGSTWFYFLLLKMKTVPSWVVPVLSLVILTINKMSCDAQKSD